MGQGATQLPSAISYSGVAGGKTLQKYCDLSASCMIWDSQRGEGQREATTVGSIQAQATQSPFALQKQITVFGTQKAQGTLAKRNKVGTLMAALPQAPAPHPWTFQNMNIYFLLHVVCKYMGSSTQGHVFEAGGNEDGSVPHSHSSTFCQVSKEIKQSHNLCECQQKTPLFI